MIVGFVDPYILACPKNLDDDDDVFAYITRLIEWRDLRSKGWLQMLLSSSAPETIIKTNGYPPWEAIKKALSNKDIGIQASDVYELLNGLLNKCPSIEEFAEIKEILVDQLSATPDYWTSRDEEYREEFQRLLGIAALIEAAGEIKSENRQVITATAPCPHGLSFSVVVVDAEYFESEKLRPVFPIKLSDKLTGVCCTRVATMEADYLSIWENAKDDDTLRAALELCVAQFELTENLKAGPWKIGPYFFESIRRMHLHSRSEGNRVLRACRETIFGLRMEDTHAIRETSGANSEQRMRGKDGAMRRDIDRELHLHYWDSSKGPELADVVGHNDFSISE